MSEPKRQPIKAFKRKVLVVVGGLSAIMAGAFAAILISAAMSGSYTVVAKPQMMWHSLAAGSDIKQIGTDGSGIDCKPSLTRVTTDIWNGPLDTVITNAMPGAQCTVQAALYGGSTEQPLRVQRVEMGDLDVKFNANSAIKCGTTLNSMSKSSARQVSIDIKIPQDVTVGTKTLPSSSAIVAVPAAQYDAALCSN